MKIKRPDINIVQILRKCYKVNPSRLDKIINDYLNKNNINISLVSTKSVYIFSLYFFKFEHLKYYNMRNFKTFFKALLLYLIFCNLSRAQSLHHQMISCQGGNSSNTSVASVSFTVGQQSVIGTATNGFTVQQGFQQSNWNKVIQLNTISVNTTVHPNPFKDVVNFSFSKSPGNDISIIVFDLLGRLVYTDVIKNEENLISVNLNNLPSAEYFVKLTSNNYIFSTKILKQ